MTVGFSSFMSMDIEWIAVRIQNHEEEDDETQRERGLIGYLEGWKLLSLPPSCPCYRTVSVSVDMKQKKLTVIGFCDPIVVVFKLRKHWYAEFVLIGRANEPGRGRVKERRETRS
ncbi:hypothetical protein B296_00002800 [Ensete ventricosum]|uniref:Uncharacterized protein n=1 Tax=Ensete ventricosum TaxID=4639 RepID=A0A426YNM0_ENSVE|nr:hypothetical protein B296_00002800 [Ensete ventricosum]